MPICEADPWRFQYFENIPCPEDVRISTEDSDSWEWYPRHRWIYDKLAVALSQGLDAAPHGVMPRSFPVFSKPIMNLRGMGTGSLAIDSAEEYKANLNAGHFWCTLLTGAHVSSDAALVNGEPRLVATYLRRDRSGRHVRSLDDPRRSDAGDRGLVRGPGLGSTWPATPAW